MPLLQHDKQYLIDNGYKYEAHELGNRTLLIVKDYKVSSVYDKEVVDVLIQIPTGYPNVQLDMFWVYPHVKIKDTGSYPPQADYPQEFFGKQWQRFSRHYAWKPIYNLGNHMNLVRYVLHNGRS